MKITMFAYFKEHQGNHKKNLRVDMVWGDPVSKLETFVWILKHISRFIAWSLFILKASYKWPVSTLSFMWWCQFIDLLKFETRSSFLLNFGTANVKHSEREILRDLSSTYLPKRGLGLGFSVAKMSQMSGVSRETIYHRMQLFGLLNTFSL